MKRKRRRRKNKLNTFLGLVLLCSVAVLFTMLFINISVGMGNSTAGTRSENESYYGYQPQQYAYEATDTNNVTHDNENVSLESIYNKIDSLLPVEHRPVKIEKENDIYKVTGQFKDSFKVLQVTDVHLSGRTENYANNIKAIESVYKLVSHEKPDFIVVSGDLIFGMPYTDANQDLESLNMAIRMMDKIGIPWTWAFGNHDHNVFDRYTDKEVENLIKNSTTLYMTEKISGVKGYSNNVFKLYNKSGKMYAALIIIDSHGGLYKEGEGEPYDYDYIDDSQVNWYKQKIVDMVAKEGSVPDTFVYTHIPLPEYESSWTEALDGKNFNKISAKAKYISGWQQEKPCYATQKSKIFEEIVRLGSTKAVLCGHDHVNDSIVKYQGIDLVYSKSIDYTAYVGIAAKTEQRGACALTIKGKSNYTIQNIRLIDIIS